MLPGRRDAQGRLDVTADPVAAGSTLRGGIACNGLGQVHITTVVSDNFVNGFMVSDTGALVMSTDPIVTYQEGLPRDALGRLRGQTDTIPAATDPFLGGIRVGPLGGVYTTLAAPPVGDPPVNAVAPDITGSAAVGQVLTCDTGTWSGTGPFSYAYQWFRGATLLAGEIGPSYTVVALDIGTAITCRVTAINVVGSGQAFALGVRIVNARYDYKTLNSVPASGQITVTGTQIRINNIDKDNINHDGPFSRLNVGDNLIINGVSAEIAVEPIETSGYWIFDVVSWAGLPDAEYFVTLDYV
jgi:hypothetical protein